MGVEIEDMYEPIGELVTREIPEDFSKLWFYFRKDDECSDMMIYYQIPSDTKNVFPFMPSAELLGELDDTLRKLWELSKREGTQWTTATLQLDGEGNFTMDYSYDTITDVPLHELDEQWQKKYLGNLKIRAHKMKLRYSFPIILEKE